MREVLRRELPMLAQYLLIACLAAAAGHYAWESAQQVFGMSGGESSQSAVNVREMEIALWRDYYRWVIGAFLGLGGIRILILLVVDRIKQVLA